MTGHSDANGRGESTESTVSRRTVLRATAGAGALVAGVNAGGFAGSATAGIAAFEDLSVDADNRIVDETGESFVVRGLSLVDPKRMSRTAGMRGKTPEQAVRLLTDADRDWYPRVIRVPVQPIDVGEHPVGWSGPRYFDEDGSLRPEAPDLENPYPVRESRRAVRPPQPKAFDVDQLRAYLDAYYDPIVELCKERGVYCIVDYHRYLHEQPPGQEEPSAAENHLPYDSEYTNYWAYNDHEEFGREVPASWGHVDQVTIDQLTPEYTDWTGIEDPSDVPGTPYAKDMWHVNEPLVEEVTLFWQEVAARYADEPHVIFEPYNEPVAPGIWGPVEGCGAVKQVPLWEVYLEEFAAPILDAIRTHAPEKLVLMSVPNRCRSTQALHWRDFSDLGYENLAVTWHNWGRDDVSQMHNWFNDIEYQSPQAVESTTGQTLDDPTLEPPETVAEKECWGWNHYESQGLQGAMEYHPVVVSQFGWRPRSYPRGVRGSGVLPPTTESYGEPFLEALESDDRIGWVAAFAYPEWRPSMFSLPWSVVSSDIDLVHDNYYHEDTELPTYCEDPPCEWDLWDDPEMGAFVKRRLAELRHDQVPFSFEGETPTEEGIELPGADGTARDLDEDGLLDDVNGNGRNDYDDAVTLFQHRDADAVTENPDRFDFNGNERVDMDDAVTLFQEQ